jgi:hypothetical protein
MTSTNEQPSAIPLDYGRAEPFWKRFTTWLREYFGQYWESIGYCLGMLAYFAGGTRQLVFAFGLAFIAGGFGMAIEHGDGGSGSFWMWIGGFLIGLVIPIPKSPSGK